MIAPDSPELVGKHLIFVDGVCVLCHGFVRFVFKHDKQKYFFVGSLQQDSSRLYLKDYIHDLDSNVLGTVRVLSHYRTSKETFLVKSNAVLFVLCHLSRGFSWVVLFYVFPRWCRDAVYDLVAAWRYRVFGMYDRCGLPEGNVRGRLLDLWFSS